MIAQFILLAMIKRWISKRYLIGQKLTGVMAVDYTIIRDEADSIAGTHMAWGNGDDGPWKSKCFFFATKSDGKITRWYVHPRRIED